jgi:hypothetical protein
VQSRPQKSRRDPADDRGQRNGKQWIGSAEETSGIGARLWNQYRRQAKSCEGEDDEGNVPPPISPVSGHLSCNHDPRQNIGLTPLFLGAGLSEQTERIRMFFLHGINQGCFSSIILLIHISSSSEQNLRERSNPSL